MHKQTNAQKTQTPLSHLELPTLDDLGDTSLLTLVLPTVCRLTTLVDTTLTGDLLLRFIICLSLLDSRVSAGLGSSWGETTVLLNSACNGSRSIGSSVIVGGSLSTSMKISKKINFLARRRHTAIVFQ